MTVQSGQVRYALAQTGRRSWTIHDLTLLALTIHPVAELRVTENDDVEVEWMTPTPLPVRYATLQDALDDLILWERRGRGATKPIPIPHHPPPHG